MSVYFIRCGRYVKVGYSEDAGRRFCNLHRGTTRYTFPADAPTDPACRELVKVIEGEKDDERTIHLALDEFSVGLEWYLDEQPVRDFIAAVEFNAKGIYPRVTREGGWSEGEYERVQYGRAAVYEATWRARMARSA